MSAQCLRLICDDQMEVIRITEELYDAVIEFFQNYFVKCENISIACNLSESPEAVEDVTNLIKAILKDNLSFAARDIKTKQLVAICVSKLLNPSAGITLDDVFESFKTPNMKAVGEYLNTMEYTYNIFKEWKLDCVIELTFLSTRTDYGRRGVGLSLSKYVLDHVAKLKEGDPILTQQLPEHLKGQKPQALVSVLTSRYSQVVGEKLGFETLLKEENSKFSFEGKTFTEKIDPQHKYSTFVAKRL